jgi:shikimate kinase
MVVELVGPAGAGKSTLAQHLRSSHATPRYLTVWGLPRLDLLASAFTLVPSLVGALMRGHRPAFRELAQMIRIDALRRVVNRETRREGVLLLDEGPVFALSWLEMRFHRNGNGTANGWHKRIIDAWAAVLDTIVYLDAPDAVLAERIRTRAKSHQVKDGSDREISTFVGQFRRAFDSVIADLSAVGHIRVTTLSTESHSLEQSADRLLAVLAEPHNGR